MVQGTPPAPSSVSATENQQNPKPLGERIEIAQEKLVPKVNVLESGNRAPDKVLEAVQANDETLAKTLDLVNRQLDI
ncbi:hypothetical protein CDAR_507761 [Caerostris darwini]|uniref:Uncharacterized protein n=1 Tax=Caerostris darwini TaxID=1538125 RepID=A0AAV4R0D4_9ARAC|nr:hypothetical protein CDAR_507761 [Caerostris darwini]